MDKLKLRKWSMALVVSVAVGLLVVFRQVRQEPVVGFEERVLVARRDLPSATRIDLADFEAHPISQIVPLPRPGAAVNDQQLHLLTGLRVQTRLNRGGLLLWSYLEPDRPQAQPKYRRSPIEVIEEQ